MKRKLFPLPRWQEVLNPQAVLGLYGLFMLTGFLLWVPEKGYSDMVNPKFRLFLYATAVFLVLLTLTLVIQGLTRKRGSLAPEKTVSKWQRLSRILAAGMMVWVLLSALLSDFPQVVWLGDRRKEGALTLLAYMLLFLLASRFWSPGKLTAMGASLTGMLNFALALAQFLGLNPLRLYPGELNFHHRGERYSGEYMGTIGNSDLLSAMLTVLCLYLLGLYCVSKEKDRWIYFAGGLAAWGALLLSEVTAGPVAILGCLALLLPLCVDVPVILHRRNLQLVIELTQLLICHV